MLGSRSFSSRGSSQGISKNLFQFSVIFSPLTLVIDYKKKQKNLENYVDLNAFLPVLGVLNMKTATDGKT